VLRAVSLLLLFVKFTVWCLLITSNNLGVSETSWTYINGFVWVIKGALVVVAIVCSLLFEDEITGR